MAIVTGIERNDVLLKYTSKEPFQQYDAQTNSYKRVYRDVFYLLKLDTRRARTNGSMFKEPWMLPFLEAIRIKVTPCHPSSQGEPRWIAVGTYKQQVHETLWEQTPVCEIAERYYNKKICNQSLSSILTKEYLFVSPEQLKLWRSIEDDPTPEEDIEWPPEPPITVFARYNLDLPNTYPYRTRW